MGIRPELVENIRLEFTAMLQVCNLFGNQSGIRISAIEEILD
jgi:hypothetical protein